MTTREEIIRRYGATWESEFRIVALGLSLEVERVDYDASYGWTVLLTDGREFEASTPAGVRARLNAMAGA